MNGLNPDAVYGPNVDLPVQGICPDGWRLPSRYPDVSTLKNYLANNQMYCGNYNYNIAKALADNNTANWNTSTNECAVGNNIASNNASGFSAIGTGYTRYSWNGTSYTNGGTSRGSNAYFWTTSLEYVWDQQGETQIFSPVGITGGQTFGFRYMDSSIDETNNVMPKHYLLPIRCIRVEAEGTVSQMQEMIDSLQNQNSQMQNQINQMQQHQQEQQNNNDPSFLCGTSKMYDIDGNEYNTLRIGNQCWMKENLRTTRYADGGTIYKGGLNDSSATYGYRYSPTNDDANVSIYGYQYNKAAVMHGASNSGTSASNVQGVCPESWHVPSNAEWVEMFNAVTSNSQYYCGTSSSNTQYYFYGIAKALASPYYWNSSSSSCTPGYSSYNNNATGFGALPASFHSKYSNHATGSEAYFWSSTTSGTQINYYVLRWCDNFVHKSNPVSPDMSSGFSVRCVRDAVDGTVYQMQETIDSLQNQINDLQNQLNQQQGSLPTATVSLVSIDYNKATVEVSFNGNGEIMMYKGICWTTSQNTTPTLSNSYMTKDTTANTFRMTFTVSMGYNYTVRAFATSINGTGYSTNLTFKVVQTVPTSGSRTITLSADSIWVYDAGGPNGYYQNNWDGYLVIKPTASDKRVKLLSGTYAFEGNSSWDYLEVYDGTQTTATSGYQAHYYASSGSVTAFTSTTTDGAITIRFRSDGSNTRAGFALKFVLVDAGPCGRATTVSDYDGNSYSIKAYGSQCWMTQNLRTIHYSDGTLITLSTSTSPTTSSSQAYRYYPNNSSSNSLVTYGYLYNKMAVMRNASSSNSNPSGVQGICPSGWHVPSNAEVTQFKNYIMSQSSNICGSTSSNIAKSLASTSNWASTTATCAIGNNLSSNNSSGFNVQPAGYIYDGGTNPEFRYFGSHSFIWTCTQYGSSTANYDLYMVYASASIYADSYLTSTQAGSVRCVKNQ